MSLEIAEDGQAFRTGRNWIRVGDVVTVERPGRRPFPAELLAIAVNEVGIFVDLFGGPKGDAPGRRTVPIDRIRGKAKAGVRVDRSACSPPAPRRRRR